MTQSCCGSKIFLPWNFKIELLEIVEKVDFEKNKQTTKKHGKLPRGQRVKTEEKGNIHRILTLSVVYLDICLFVGVDTRTLTKKIREKGTMLGKVRSREITEIKGDYSISMAKRGYSLGRG